MPALTPPPATNGPGGTTTPASRASAPASGVAEVVVAGRPPAPPDARDDARAPLASSSSSYMYVAPATWLLLGGCYLVFRAARHRLRRAGARGDHNDEYDQRDDYGSDDDEDDKYLTYGDIDEENADRGVARQADWERDFKTRGGHDRDHIPDRDRDRDRNRNQDRDLDAKARDEMTSLGDGGAWAPPPRHKSPTHPLPSPPTTSPAVTAPHNHKDNDNDNDSDNSSSNSTPTKSVPPPSPPTLEEQFLDGPSYTWAEDAASSAEVSLADLSDLPAPVMSVAGAGAVAGTGGQGTHTRRKSYTKSSGGVEVVGEVVVGEGWRRHTRVYGGGVCLACLESERMRAAMGSAVDAGGS